MGIQLFKWGRDMLIHVIKTLIYQLILYDQSRLKDLSWRGNHHSWGLKIKAVGVGSIFVFCNAFLNGVSFFECRLNPRKDDRVSEDPPTIFSKIHDEINNTLRWIINANLSGINLLPPAVNLISCHNTATTRKKGIHCECITPTPCEKNHYKATH